MENNETVQGVVLHCVRALLLVCIFALAAFSVPAFGADQPLKERLETIRSALSDVDTELKKGNLSDADFARLRADNDPLSTQLQAIISEVTPRLDASQKRLNELKPKSKDESSSNDAASDALKAEQTNFDKLDGELRSARAMLLQADDNAARIGTARRELFARQTFVRTSSVLSPFLWIALAREAPGDLLEIGAVLSDWLRSMAQRTSWVAALQVFGLSVALTITAVVVRRISHRVIARSADVSAPSRFRRALAASWTILVLAALPLAALGILSYALDAFDISDPRLQGAVNAAFDGMRMIILAYAFGRGFFAPDLPNWRLLALSNRSAGLIFRFLMSASVAWACATLFEPVAEEVGSLNISIAARGSAALVISLLAAAVLRRLGEPAAANAPANDPWAPARSLGWVVAIIICGCAITGYIALSTFLINQIFVVTSICAALYLIDATIHESAELVLRPDFPMAPRLYQIIGLRRGALEQIVVLIQGFVRLAALAAAFLAAVGPLGMPSQDLLASIRAAYFGFTIGGITISLSSLLSAVIIFSLCLIATKAGQRWLGERFLPRTHIDAGASNSISTIFGYMGIVVGVLFAGSRIGLDAQKFALVAGGLSVGIGFGLQGIANNFVSGLILLWERGIRVGDWVVVGAEQGFVRRINARSTEIETFDRATLIVPNQTLVTGSVKNWMHTDRVARIVITINVDFDTNLDEVRAILIASAKSRDEVLSIPAPLVLFSEFADWALKFQLICYVDDAVIAERTRSEINFEVHRRIKEARLHVPYPYPTAKDTQEEH